MSRNAVAEELSRCIAQLNTLAEQAERLAAASGGMVDPKHFRAMRTCAALAAGDLDSKGLLVRFDAQPTTAGGA